VKTTRAADASSRASLQACSAATDPRWMKKGYRRKLLLRKAKGRGNFLPQHRQIASSLRSSQ
jgi:hypothetical protein